MLVEMSRRRPPRAFRMDRVLRPFAMGEARAQSMLGLCKLRPGGGSGSGGAAAGGGGSGGAASVGAATADALHAPPAQEFYVDHFTIEWTTRYRTAGPPLLLLITSGRVVLGDEERLRPLWEVPLERIAPPSLPSPRLPSPSLAFPRLL